MRRHSLRVFGFFLLELLHFELEDFGHKVGQSVIDLEQRVEVTRITNVAKTCWLVFFPDSLIHAGDWLIIAVVSSFNPHAFFDGFLHDFVLHGTVLASEALVRPDVGGLALLVHARSNCGLHLCVFGGKPTS